MLPLLREVLLRLHGVFVSVYQRNRKVMRMKRFVFIAFLGGVRKATLFSALALIVIAFCQTASGATLLQDNFDSYPDQAAFLAAWPQVGVTAAATFRLCRLSAPRTL